MHTEQLSERIEETHQRVCLSPHTRGYNKLEQAESIDAIVASPPPSVVAAPRLCFAAWYPVVDPGHLWLREFAERANPISRRRLEARQCTRLVDWSRRVQILSPSP